MAVISMQTIRYINLLDKVTGVKTRKCFVHNNTVFFAVDRGQVSRAIGPGAVNIQKIQNGTGKRVKIVEEANGIENAQRFIGSIVAPVRFKSLEIKNGEIIITAGSNQNKASLIGRNRRRFEELKKIVQDYFNLDLKIV
ncbi:KH domain-containing protein [Candidatus Pacearchaeota archaeon]|nr:hypothetical protein [uncultured archaeon]AQS31862.1 hypothetical protein [uncultured archaeon]MBS3088559.1 KH domain-containing protein [Candidatus Pacearchaeota archaeon]